MVGELGPKDRRNDGGWWSDRRTTEQIGVVFRGYFCLSKDSHVPQLLLSASFVPLIPQTKKVQLY